VLTTEDMIGSRAFKLKIYDTKKDKMEKYCSAFVLQMLCLYKHNTMQSYMRNVINNIGNN